MQTTQPELVAACALFTAPANHHRNYITGIHIEPHDAGGIVIVATDGRVMGVGYDPEGSIDPSDPSDIVRLPERFTRSLKVKARSACWCYLEINSDDAGTALLYEGSDGADVKRADVCAAEWIKSDYPDWRRVVPLELATDFCYPIRWGLASKYLALFDKAARVLAGSGRTVSIQPSTDDGSAPFVVRLSGINNWFAIIMPASDAESDFVPDWMDFHARRHPLESAA